MYIRRKKWLLLLCVVIFGYVALTYIDFMVHCSDNSVKEALKSLCALYQQSEVDGLLCHAICNGNIEFVKCLYIKGGKTVVLATLNGDNIIIKASKANLNDYDQVSYLSNGEKSFPSPTVFAGMVYDSIRFNFLPNLSQNDPILTKISEQHGNYMKSESMQSVWSLLQQDEYVFMEINRNKTVIPNILGTCGHFYGVEYAPPRSGLEEQGLDTLFHTRVPFIARAKVAVQLLEAIKLLETDFAETVHVCDTKGENFGMTKDGTVKVIDTDMVFSHSHLMRQFQSETCSRHSQCDFFDCRGICDFQNDKCVQQRSNNNLQVVCRKIFLSKITSGFGQLLQDPPSLIKQSLESLLQNCALEIPLPHSVNDGFNIQKNISRSDLNLLKNIKGILLYSIHLLGGKKG